MSEAKKKIDDKKITCMTIFCKYNIQIFGYVKYIILCKCFYKR